LQPECAESVPGIPAFLGTSYYTSTTISRANLARPFPQFSGNMTQLGRNDSYIRYDSAQFNYNVRMRGGLILLANYTLSKQIEEWGFNDPYNNVKQKGLYFLDRPHVLSLRAFGRCPSAKARSSAQAATGSSRSSFPAGPGTARSRSAEGLPSDMPNAIQLKDPLTPLKDSSGNILKDAQGAANLEWPDRLEGYQVRMWNPGSASE